jgi:hypothetical protein
MAEQLLSDAQVSQTTDSSQGLLSDEQVSGPVDNSFGASAAKEGQDFFQRLAPSVATIIRASQIPSDSLSSVNEYLKSPDTSMLIGPDRAAAKKSGIPMALYEPAAIMYDALFRPMAAAFAGVETGLQETGELDSPSAGRELAMLPQAFPFGLHETMGIPHPAALENYAVRAPENVYMGLERPTAEQEAVANQAARAAYMEKQRGLVNPEQGPSVETLAREAEPEVFKQKDDLESQFSDLRDKAQNGESYFGPEYDEKLAALKARASSSMRADPELEGEGLAKAVEEGGKKYEGVAAEIRQLGTRDEYIKEQVSQARDGMQELDGKLKDIAATGKVKAAYDQAAEQVKAWEPSPADDGTPGIPREDTGTRSPVEPKKSTLSPYATANMSGREEPYGPVFRPTQFMGPWDVVAQSAHREEAPQGATAMAAENKQPSVKQAGPWGNPSAKFPSDKVDKAGNFNLNNINAPEDIKDVLRETAKSNDNFMAERRGVVSNGTTLDLADALGLSPAMLDMRKVGEAFNAEEIVGAVKLLLQSAAEVSRTSELEGDAGDAAYIEAKMRHQMIQGHVSGIAAEAGRALQIFQALKKIEGYNDTKALGNFLKDNDNAKTLDDLKKEKEYVRKLTDSKQVSRFIEDSKNPKFKDRMLYYYLNALLSGPFTHARYSVGNMLNAVMTPLVEIPLAAGYGAAREALGYKVENRVYLGEAGAQLYAMGHGMGEGMRAALKAWQDNFSAPLPKERGTAPFDDTPPIPGVAGQVIGLPMRSVASIHSFSKTLRYEQNIAGLAYRQAMKEKLSGDAFINRVSDLTSKPTDEMMQSATKDALKETYMAPTDYHSFMGGVQRLTNDYAVAKVMVPFAKVGGQITKNAFLERTPLGAFNKEIRENLSGKNGGTAQDMQAAKMTAGIAVIGGSVVMTLRGLATGDGPEDPKQRATWLLTHKPNHFQIGNVTVPYQGLGPYGVLMRFAANMTETAQGWDGQDGHKLAVSALEGMSKSVLDDNFMRGVKDALDAVYHPEEYGDKYLRDFATNWLPFSVGLGQTAREVDPYRREANDIFSAARSKIPVWSEGLQPVYDMFGNPVKNGSTYDQYKTDPVVQRLEALHTGIGRPEKSIIGVKLTDDQYADYSRIAGQITHMMLSGQVQGMQLMPPGEQILKINRTVETAREIARSQVKFNPANSNIIREAIAKKQAIFMPADEPVEQ